MKIIYGVIPLVAIFVGALVMLMGGYNGYNFDTTSTIQVIGAVIAIAGVGGTAIFFGWRLIVAVRSLWK